MHYPLNHVCVLRFLSGRTFLPPSFAEAFRSDGSRSNGSCTRRLSRKVYMLAVPTSSNCRNENSRYVVFPSTFACLIQSTDLSETLNLVPECKSPCSGCSYKPHPRVWLHPSCYDILMISYKPSEKPTSEELEKLADAIRPSYECQDKNLEKPRRSLKGCRVNIQEELLKQPLDRIYLTGCQWR